MNVTVDQLKDELSDALNSLTELSRMGNVASVAEAIGPALVNLKRDEYTVVVCGEVKQGKTSFINALLGQNLLPVAVKIATSQVFRISHAEKESFFLVFDNGEREEITREEMVRYGTETGENLDHDERVRGRSLRWIEVNVPATFLPPNVHLLDTPGLGALYHQHALITRKYVAAADGVIFVKEAKDPIVDQERDFLKKVFGITKNVLFVQSKCDLYNEDERAVLAKRSEEILNKEFGALVGRKFRFWPVSSQNLFDAAQEQDLEARNFLKEVSGFDPMLAALKDLLFRAAGYLSASSAYVAAFKGYQTLATSFLEQKKILGTTDVQEKQKLQKEKTERQQEFLRKWGPSGTELKAVNDNVRKIISAGQMQLQNIFAAGGEIRQQFVAEINELTDSPKVIETYAKAMPDRLLNSVCVKWDEISNNVQKRLGAELNRYSVEMSRVDGGGTLIEDQREAVKLNHDGKFELARNTTMGGGIGFTLASLGIDCILPTCLFAGPLGPVVALGIFGAATVAGIVGAKNASNKALSRSNKNILQSFIGNQLAKLEMKLCREPQESGLTRLQEFCEAQRTAVQEACKTLSERERNQLDQEVKLLVDAASANADEARKSMADLSSRMAQLPPIKEKLTRVYSALTEYEKIESV